MQIKDLIDNKEFSFNVNFNIVKYAPTPYDPDYVNVLYASSKDNEIPYELYDMHISAINQNDDGSINLEVY